MTKLSSRQQDVITALHALCLAEPSEWFSNWRVLESLKELFSYKYAHLWTSHHEAGVGRTLTALYKNNLIERQRYFYKDQPSKKFFKYKISMPS